MIRNWLLKYWWVNELGKTIVAVFLGFFGYASWEGGKLASTAIASPDSYNLMVFGIITGLMGISSLLLLIDVVYSIKGHFKDRNKHNYLGGKE